MARRPFHRSDTRWLGLLVFVLIVPWVLPDLHSEISTDSYQSGPRGKKAIYRIIQRLGAFEVSRNLDRLDILLASLAGSENETVILFLGPARTPTAREWERLHNFVAGGGGLVYAVTGDAKEFRAPAFGVQATELDEPIRLAANADAALETNLGDLPGTFSWRSEWEWIDSAGTPVLMIDRGDDPDETADQQSVQALLVERGRGAALFVASAAPFQNYTLTWPDNTRLVVRLIERLGHRRRIVFDERLNSSGIPKVVATLLDPPLRALSLHLLAGVCVFGWWSSRRFGPLLAPKIPVRSNVVEHADAVGLLHYRSRNSAAVVRLYLQHLRVSLQLRKLNGARERRILEPIARRRGHSLEDVQRLLREAIAASKQENLDRAAAGRLIRRLAKLRRAAEKDRRYVG